MELTIDIKARVITLTSNISVSELYNFLKTAFPKDYKKYTIIPNTSYMTYTDCFSCPYKPYRKIYWDGTTPLFNAGDDANISLYTSGDAASKDNEVHQKYTVHFQKHNKV